MVWCWLASGSCRVFRRFSSADMVRRSLQERLDTAQKRVKTLEEEQSTTKQKQALNQGGCVVIEGRKRVLLMHRDRSTGDHVAFSEVFKAIETRSMGGTEDDDGRR